MMSRVYFPLRLLVFGLILTFSVSCGGGGGGGGQAAGGLTPVTGTGTFGISFTDAPSDEFAEINLTITRIILIGNSGQVDIFDSSQTIDLLKLTGFADLFAISDNVPAGFYSKIRLLITDLELVRKDANGTITETIHPPLPANGRVDLNPEGPFSVPPGGTVIAEVDVDTDRSIHAVQTGSGGYQFRPVVFVRILSAFGPSKLHRIHGVVAEVDDLSDNFVLCPTRVLAGHDLQHDFGNQQRCFLVGVDSATGVFDSNGDPVAADVIDVNTELTAVGHFDLGGAPKTENDEHFDIMFGAAVIEIGGPNAFAHLGGTARSAVSISTFDFEIGEDQGFGTGTTMSTLLQQGTRIFLRNGSDTDISAIQPDSRALVDGVVVVQSADPDFIKSALVVIDDGSDFVMNISGKLLSIDTDLRELMISTLTGDRCTLVPEDAVIVLVTSASDGLSSEMVGLEDLLPGMDAHLFGQEDPGGCFDAKLVVAIQD